LTQAFKYRLKFIHSFNSINIDLTAQENRQGGLSIMLVKFHGKAQVLVILLNKFSMERLFFL